MRLRAQELINYELDEIHSLSLEALIDALHVSLPALAKQLQAQGGSIDLCIIRTNIVEARRIC